MTVQNKKENKAKKINKSRGHTVAGLIAIFVLAFTCIVVNANGAAWGGNAGFDSLMISLFFILLWSMFIVIYRDNSVLAKILYMLSLLLCMAAACGFVLRLTSNGGFISALVISIVAVPFYGFTMFADWTIVYGIATAFTLWWMLYTGANVRRLKEETVKEEVEKTGRKEPAAKKRKEE